MCVRIVVLVQWLQRVTVGLGSDLGTQIASVGADVFERFAGPFVYSGVAALFGWAARLTILRGAV